MSITKKQRRQRRAIKTRAHIRVLKVARLTIFRTPRHIIRLMVELTAPVPGDVVCDPASGTCGFLVATGEYLRQEHPELFANPKQRKHFHRGLFRASPWNAVT